MRKRIRRATTWGPSINFEEDDIHVWGMSKKAAWVVFGLLLGGAGGGGWILLFFWYRDYNSEKVRRQIEAGEWPH